MRERAARRRARPASALTVLVAGVALSVAAVPASGAPPAARAAPGAAARPARRCAVNLAGELASTGPARQLVTVVAKDPRSTYADVTTWQRRDGCWVRAAGPFAARVGVSGISQHKVEGDGTTPAGIFGVGPVMYGNAANPGVHYPYHRLVCGDWWDEVPSSRWYNSFRHVACGSRPSWTYGDSEALWTETTAYGSFAWIEYNTDPVVPGRGSAIFLHDGFTHATAGCVSLHPGELDTVLDWLRADDDPRVIIGTGAEVRHY